MADESESWLKVGTRVLVKDKNWQGMVRFFGRTEFAPGKWVGVELDEALGKNNGTVKGKSYFTCQDQHGLMVRSTQLEPLSSSAMSSIPMPRSHRKPGSGVGGSGASPGLSRRSQLPKPNASTPSQTPKFAPKAAPSAAVAEERPSTQPAAVTPGDAPLQVPGSVLAPASPVVSRSHLGGGEPPQEVTDLQQKLAILQSKRQDDKARIKELEKYRMQFQQMVDYKAKWTESQADLVQQLKQAKKEAREAMLLKEQAEEEMRELADTVEIATLDKEMAEEKCENLQAEIELLKEEKKEITIDLDIIRDEIKESGYEGAAASAELKQLEQQNARLKEALVRLRDLSTHEKQEHQRLLKDMEKQTTALVTLRDNKERLEAELKEADGLIDELKEQVDVALGAEDMVEKLTEKNLDLEEQIQELQEKANDLEELRELSEQQEELIMETEHELREEVDMSQNQIRQLERRLDASQDTIIDQQQTIEKFREVVRHLQSDINELRQQSKEGREGSASSAANVFTSPDTMLSQLKTTAIKTYSRTIDYELRKLEAQQSFEMINVLKSFMPNTFLVSGGDYDALNVFMLLPRMIFKLELIIEQLRQQTSLEEILGTGTVLKPSPKTDLLAYTAFLIFKLTTLQLLVNKAIRALSECDVQLYRQMGCLRDDLALHERALDILIELLKKEQLDESVPLNGVEKAITHFENLLQTRLTHVPQRGQTDLLLDQIRVMMAGCNFCSVELMRIRSHAQETSSFVSQLKELDTLFGDVHLCCRKIRRRVPSTELGKMVVCPPELMVGLIQKQLMLATNLRALYVRVNQKAQALSEGESLTNGELETFLQDVTKMVLQEMLVAEETTPEELMHVTLLKVSKTLDKFLSELQEGMFDQESPKTKEVSPVVTRAQVVKGELSDTEGLKFKVEEKNKEILELKKAVKLKVQEIGEVNIKVGLLEKKLETADAECARKVDEEQQETERIRNIMENQERKFNKAIEVLQEDIEALENEKDSLRKQLDKQVRVTAGPEVSIARRSHTVVGRPTISALLRSPGMSRKTVPSDQISPGGGGATEAEPPSNSPLLLSRIDSLRKALSLTQEENARLKGQIAKAQMASLKSLQVPRRLLSRGHGSKPESDQEQEDENKSDLEKSIRKEKSVLFKELTSLLSGPLVVDITRKPDTGKTSTELTPREKLNLQISSLLQLRQKSSKLREDSQRLVASSLPGGTVQSQVKGFVTPQFTKALDETSSPLLVAKLKLPPSASPSCGSTATPRKLLLSMRQFQALHSMVAT